MELGMKGIVIAILGLLMAGVGILIGMLNDAEVIPVMMVEFTWMSLIIIIGYIFFIIGLVVTLIGIAKIIIKTSEKIGDMNGN